MSKVRRRWWFAGLVVLVALGATAALMRRPRFDPEVLVRGRTAVNVENVNFTGTNPATFRLYEWREDPRTAYNRIEKILLKEGAEVSFGDRQPMGWYIDSYTISVAPGRASWKTDASGKRIPDPDGDKNWVNVAITHYSEPTVLDKILGWFKRPRP
ncbi:MAG: hypothetical protein ABL962_17735 [Fimbriimonadaceae bacterium]